MKYLVLFILLLTISFGSYSKGKTGKTFLVLFDKTELKIYNSSTEFIELTFFDKYPTRSYTGNSEAALLITVPVDNLNECDMGELLVRVNHSTWLPLHEIAFRIIDLTKSTESYHALLKASDERLPLKAKPQLVRVKL